MTGKKTIRDAYTVLVTGAGALLGQGILRSLERCSLPLRIVAADPSPLAAGLYWTDHRVLLPMASDPRFVDRFEDALRAVRPDVVLIGTDVELLPLADHRERLEREHRTHVVVSSPDVVRIADDKWLTYRFLADNGFPGPDSALNESAQVEALVQRVGFPLVVKPRVGARSVGVRVVRTRQELDRALGEDPSPIVQECVATDKDEYTAGTLTFDGTCHASIVMRRDLRDGNTYRAYVEDYADLDRQVRAIATRLGAYGPANFQFREVGGIAKVFEINGRFSGTTPLRALAGFNEVEMVLRRVLLNEPVQQPPIQKVTILRHWAETVVETNQLMRAPQKSG